MTKEQILDELREANSLKEWTDVCDAVKYWTKTQPEADRSGDYPKWWFQEVVLSGLMGEVQARWVEEAAHQRSHV